MAAVPKPFRPSLLIGPNPFESPVATANTNNGAGFPLDPHEPSAKNRGLQAQLEKDLAELKEARLATIPSASGTSVPLFTSVPEPMDARHFSRQRETILGRVMHVPPPEPVLIHGNMLKEEVDLAMHPILTYANLPVVMYDFFRRRTEECVQKKYLHLLRWARYATTTKVMESMGKTMTECLSAIAAEYSDGLRRMERLSVVLEDLSDHLADENGTILICPYDGTLPQKRQAALREAVRVSDMQTYMRWGIHHRRSLRSLHDFFRRMQWMALRNPDLADPVLPPPGSGLAQGVGNSGGTPSDSEYLTPTSSRVYSQPTDEGTRAAFLTEMDPAGAGAGGEPDSGTPAPKSGGDDRDIPATGAAAASEAAFKHAVFALTGGEIVDACPVYMSEFEAIRPRIHYLGRLFKLEINFNDFGSQIELFYFVTRRFGNVFRQQTLDRSYPVYDTAINVSRSVSHADITTGTTHLKEATWLSACTLREDLDAEHELGRSWIKQGHSRETDELLKAHAALLANDDQSYVQLRLREHAENALRLPDLHPTAAAGEPRVAPGAPDVSDALWRAVYADAAIAPPSTGATLPPAAAASLGRVRIENSGTEKIEKDPLLGLVFLSYMRTRDLQQKVRDSLNYMRSLERTLAIDYAGGYARSVTKQKNGGSKSQRIGGESIIVGDDRAGEPEAHPGVHSDAPSDFAATAQAVMQMAEIENRDDYYTVEDGRVRVKDSRGVYVMYDVTLKDFASIETELLAIATHYIERAGALSKEAAREAALSQSMSQSLGASVGAALFESGLGKSKTHSKDKSSAAGELDIAAYSRQRIDRSALLLDAWGFEYEFHAEKMRLIDSYMQIYDNTFDVAERKRIAHIVYNLIRYRPCFDPTAPYFASVYAIETDILRSHRELIVEAANRMIDSERVAIRRAHDNADAMDRQQGAREGVERHALGRQGLPDNFPAQFQIKLRPNRTGIKNEYLMEFHPCLASLSRLPSLLSTVSAEFARMRAPASTTDRLVLTRRVAVVVLAEYRLLPIAPLVANAPPPSHFLHNALLTSTAGPTLHSKTSLASNSRESFERSAAEGGDSGSSTPVAAKTGPALKAPSSRTRAGVNQPAVVAGTPQERMRNIHASLLPEDPLAATLAAGRAAEAYVATISGRDYSAGGIEEFGEHLEDAEDLSAPRIRTWMLALELLEQRQRLLDALDETDILERVYKEDARAMGHASRRVGLCSIEYESPGSCLTEKLRELEREGQTAQPKPNLMGGGDYAERPPDLAVCEIDEELGNGFDFSSLDGLQRQICDVGVERLRLALAAQVAHKNALIATALFHAECVSVYSASNTVRTTGGSGSGLLGESMPAGGPAITVSGVDPSASLNASGMGFALRDADVSRRLAKSFVSVRSRKLEARNQVYMWFAREYKRGCAISGGEDAFPESTDAFMRSRRAGLVARFTQTLVADIGRFSMRVQLNRHLRCIKTLLKRFPLRDAHFGFSPEDPEMFVAHPPLADRGQSNHSVAPVVGQGGASSVPSSAQPTTAAIDSADDESKFFRGLSRVSRRPLQLLTDDGTHVVNPWYLPSQREALEMFDQELPAGQTAALAPSIEIVSSMHDVFAFLYTHARFSLAGTEPVIPMHAAEGIAAELQRIMTQIDKLPDPASPADVVGFLARLREVYLVEFELALRYRIPETFLAGDHVSAVQILARNFGRGTFEIFRAGSCESAYATYAGRPVLEDRMGGSVCVRQMFPHRHFASRAGPLPGCMLPWHLTHRNLELTLLHLTDHDKSYAHGEVLGVRLQMEDYLQEHGIAATDQPLESIALARRFLVSFLRLEKLKRFWAADCLGLESVDTWQAYADYAKGFQQLLASAQKYYGLDSPEAFAEAQRGDGSRANRSGPSDAAGGVGEASTDLPPKTPGGGMGSPNPQLPGLRSTSKDFFVGGGKAAAVLGEAGARLYSLRVLRDALECHMIRKTRASVARAHALLLTEMARSTARDFGADTEDSETQADILHCALARLSLIATVPPESRRESTDSRHPVAGTEHLGKRAMVAICDVEDVFRQLGTELLRHESRRMRTLEDGWQRRVNHAGHVLYLREQEILALQRAAGNEEANRRLLARTQLAGDALELVMEVTALRAKVKELSESQRSYEAKVREGLRKDYEDLVNSLAAVTFAIKSHFHEYRCALYEDIIEAVADVRKDTLERMIRSSTRRTEGEKEAEVARVFEQEDTMTETIQENTGLWSIVLKMKVMQEFKGMGLRASYEKRLRNLQSEVLQTKRRLLDEQMESKQSLRSLTQQNNALLKQLGACEVRLLHSEEQTQLAQKELQSLSAWRAARAKELQALEQRAKRSDKFRNVNVDELLRDLEEKDSLLKELSDAEARQVRQTQFDSTKAGKIIKHLEKNLRHETEMKRQAFETIDRLQGQMERLQSECDAAEAANSGYMMRGRGDMNGFGSSGSLDGPVSRRPGSSLEAHQRALENAAYSINGSYGNIVARLGAHSRASSPRADSPQSGRRSPHDRDSPPGEPTAGPSASSALRLMWQLEGAGASQAMSRPGRPITAPSQRQAPASGNVPPLPSPRRPQSGSAPLAQGTVRPGTSVTRIGSAGTGSRDGKTASGPFAPGRLTLAGRDS